MKKSSKKHVTSSDQQKVSIITASADNSPRAGSSQNRDVKCERICDKNSELTRSRGRFVVGRSSDRRFVIVPGKGRISSQPPVLAGGKAGGSSMFEKKVATRLNLRQVKCHCHSLMVGFEWIQLTVHQQALLPTADSMTLVDMCQINC